MDDSILKRVNLPKVVSVSSDEVDGPTDETLALRLKAGEEGAFDELVRRHQARLFGVAYRITGSREDALDVTQEVFIKAYRKIGSWRPSGKFGAWLMRMAVNQSIDSLRRAQRRPTIVPFEGVRARALETSSDAAALGARGAEVDARIQSALQTLSPSQRSVFVLRHYEGHALADIAPIMGCTVGSVKVHLFRALKKLRVELDDLKEIL